MLAILLLFIIGIEIFYWYQWNHLLPANDKKNYTWGQKINWNELGFREKEFKLQPFNGFRIMVLGDSLTWGAGLSESQRYSNLLGEYLREGYLDKNIEVLNFGLSGGATTDERDILQKYYQVLKPDLVIVGFCLNDPQPEAQNWSQEREYYFNKIKPFSNFLSKIRFRGTLYILTRTYENFLLKTDKIPFWTEALNRTYELESKEWREFRQSLKDIVKMSGEITPHPPLFVSLNQGVSKKEPTDYNNQSDEFLNLFLKWYHQAEEAAAEAGFITTNYEEEFRTELKNHIMAVVPGKDGHPTFEMNKIYAKKLADVIIKNNLIDENFSH